MSSILTDLMNLAADAFPLPDFTLESEVSTWATRLTPQVVHLVYEAGGLLSLKQSIESASDADWDDAKATCCSAAPGKFGDGSILRWIIENKELIFQIISIFMAFKANPPIPAPDTGPVE